MSPFREFDIASIARYERAFQNKLDELRARIGSDGFSWYPYQTLGAFEEMSNAVTGERRCPLDLIGNEPVADFGCGDGDLAVFLETLGCQVYAFDYAPTNANHMKGICRLAEALGSSVRIHNVNVDAGFSLPAGRFGAVFAFGLLYHLKNPFGVLQSLARQSRHLFLSTRIARFAPDLSTRLQHIPVAYLLGDREANDDWTNYWIFSEAGLKRLLERTQWEVCDFFTRRRHARFQSHRRPSRRAGLLHRPKPFSRSHAHFD